MLKTSVLLCHADSASFNEVIPTELAKMTQLKWLALSKY
jgi:hypothetical protein